MITISTNILMLCVIMWMISSTNPMKTCMLTMTASAMIFHNMMLKAGLSWFPLTMFMLFTGGVLMMFMVVSSVNPNKKMGPLNSVKSIVIILSITVIATMHQKMSTMPEETQMEEMKWFFTTKESVAGTITIMMTYFVAFLTFMNKSNLSMRSTMCQ